LRIPRYELRNQRISGSGTVGHQALFAVSLFMHPSCPTYRQLPYVRSRCVTCVLADVTTVIHPVGGCARGSLTYSRAIGHVVALAGSDVYGEALRTAGPSGTLLHWQVQNLYPCLTLSAFRSSPSGAEQVDYAFPACKLRELERSRCSKERTQRPFSQLRYT
jgi:hypothetical protein